MKKPCRYLAPRARSAAPPRAGESRGILGEETWWEPPRSAGVVVTESTALQLPAILSTIAVLATDVAVLPLRVHRRLPDGSREDRPDHPVDTLFARSPDDETTPLRWKQAFVGRALQCGNAYAEIVRNGRGQVASLHILDSITTKPDRSSGKLVYRLGGRDAGKSLPKEKVLHLAGFGPDGLSGYNLIRLVQEGIGVGLAAQGYGADYFANGAEPGGVITHPKTLKDGAIKNLRESWDRKHSGAGNRHRPAILEEGATWTPTSVNPEKAQLLETRKFQVTDATRPWRVPPHKIGDYSNAHLANIEASNLDYLTTALLGWLVGIEEEFSFKLFSLAEYRAGYYLEHNVSALLRGDTAGRFAAYGVALRDGWLNRDEVRRRENLNPIGKEKGGEAYLVQLALAALEAVADGATAPAPAGDPAPKPTPEPDPDTPPEGPPVE